VSVLSLFSEIFADELIVYRFGFAFMGAKWSEEKLISLAYAFEQRTMARNKHLPYILPTTELADVVSSNGSYKARL
jgi:hypothetical protein